MTLALIIDYSTHQYKDTKLVFTEILGLLGGLFALYLKITQFIGKIILKILYHTKKKERLQMMEDMKDNVITLGIRKSSSEDNINYLK